jgi:hypothetical protein
VNAEVSLIVNGIHVRNFGCGIKRAGTTRGVNLSFDCRPCSRVAIPNEPEQRSQQENDDLVYIPSEQQSVSDLIRATEIYRLKLWGLVLGLPAFQAKSAFRMLFDRRTLFNRR